MKVAALHIVSLLRHNGYIILLTRAADAGDTAAGREVSGCGSLASASSPGSVWSKTRPLWRDAMLPVLPLPTVRLCLSYDYEEGQTEKALETRYVCRR